MITIDLRTDSGFTYRFNCIGAFNVNRLIELVNRMDSVNKITIRKES